MQSPIINVMSAAAIKAGKGLLRDFGEVDQLQISRKGAANFVTASDVRTEKLLRQELEKARPEFGFLLEEGGEIKGKSSEYRWIIDPLDGTSNFIHAIPYFCISIGLERRTGDKNEIVAGVIFDPVHNELFTAEKDKGAFLNNRRLMVSAREKIEEALLVTNSFKVLIDHAATPPSLFSDISRHSAVVRSLGATALDLAYLAAGRIDACWYYSLKAWDIAAGMLLVQEAGGVISEIGGAPAHPYSSTFFASNRALASPVHSLLSPAA
jgi:myo-inositol-1(or 4)-monophosphatase